MNEHCVPIDPDKRSLCRICRKCGDWFPLVLFPPNATCPDGLAKFCILCKRAYRRAHYAKNADHIRSLENPRFVKMYAANKEHHRLRTRSYVAAHPEKVQAWKTLKKEQIAATSRKWKQANRDRVNEQKRRNAHIRRTTFKDGTRITKQGWLALCEKYDNKCLCCGCSDKPLTIDHVVPVSLGGSNHMSNLQPLCGSCNRKKHLKIIDYRPQPETTTPSP